MGSKGVVSIRVEALGVSITIVDGNIAIEQTKTEVPADGAAPKVEGPAAATNQAAPVSAVVTERVVPLPERVDDSTVWGDPGAGNSAPVINAPRRPSPPQRSGQTKPVWSDEEVKKLTTLWPTHPASAIARQLGRGFNAVRGKARNLGLRKAAHPRVIVKSSPPEVKPAPKPKPLSAAVTADPAPVLDGFSTVSLFDHHPGQCRWIVSDVWPVVYCGAPVVDSPSWCEQHSRQVFNPRPQGLIPFPNQSDFAM
jgi:hypothetical protein